MQSLSVCIQFAKQIRGRAVRGQCIKEHTPKDFDRSRGFGGRGHAQASRWQKCSGTAHSCADCGGRQNQDRVKNAEVGAGFSTVQKSARV